MALIDIHHHILPPRFVAERRDEILYYARDESVLNWTPAGALAALDEFEIATAYTSLGVPGAGTARLARECNEYAADLARSHPGRFGVLASLPLPDVEASLAELAHALDVLGADGVALLSNYEGRHLGSPEFAPLFDELDRRRAVVHVHPIAPPACRGALDGLPDPFLEFPFDTTRTVTSLLLAGALERWPHVSLVFSHGGGAVAMLAQRILARAPAGALAALRALRVDAVTTTSPGPFDAVLALVGSERVLFGSDYPYVPIEVTAGGLRELELGAGALEAIGAGNASDLFGRP